MKKSVVFCIVFIGLLWVAYILSGAICALKSVHAQEKFEATAKIEQTSWIIFQDAGTIVTKVQDGKCSLYVARSYVGVTGKGNSVAIATGQGCK